MSAETPMAGTLAVLVARADQSSLQRLDWRNQVRAVLLAVATAVALLSAWSASAPLAGAVVAPAEVRVEYKRKTVQHQEGGIVRAILVRDGQHVQTGDPLVVIGDMRQEAELRLLEDQRRATRARMARSEAESRLERFDPPRELAEDAAAGPHVAREQAVFAARRGALDEQTRLLEDQLRETERQGQALDSQVEALANSARLAEEELGINDKLATQGFVSRTRIIALQRAVADARSRIGEARSDLAAARQRGAELRSRIAQLRVNYRTQATDEAKEAATRLRELDERLLPSKDQVERQVVRAPVDGDVMSLRVSAAGAVVAPRESLLEVVPQHEKLVVDARVSTQDIEHVRVGGAAEVRLVSDDARRAPLLPATVTFVSADRVTQAETGRSWFDVTVEVDAQALERSEPPVRLQAGMPAELFVTTGERTLIEYLAKPLRTFSQRALREPG